MKMKKYPFDFISFILDPMYSFVTKRFRFLYVHLLLAGTVQGEDPSIVIDLREFTPESGKMTRIHGYTGNGSFGVPVTGGYDCDGDGFLDTAMAAAVADPLERIGAGEVYLIFGRGGFGEIIDIGVPQSRILKILGAQPHEITGSKIWMDDVNGDGLGDLLIGRQNHSPEEGRPGAGGLTIIFGNPNLAEIASAQQVIDLADSPMNIEVMTLFGGEAYDRLGLWLHTGDVTGDGIADIIIGADETDSEDEENRGAGYLIRGGSHLRGNQTIDVTRTTSSTLEGHVARIDPPTGSAGFHLGGTCHIADLDGNGRAEVLLAAALNRAGAQLRLPDAPAGTGEFSGGAPLGKLFIAWDDNFPEALWPTDYRFGLGDPTPGSVSSLSGSSLNRYFGEDIVGGFDCSGDGKPELLVGDLTGEGNGIWSGLGFLYYNAAELKGRNIDMTNPPDDLDFSLIRGPQLSALGFDNCATGDFDGDGLGDVMIASPWNDPADRVKAGSVHVLYGRLGGWPSDIDLADGRLPSTEIMRIARIDAAYGVDRDDRGDTLGYTIDSADLNQDGRTDLLVNEMLGNGVSPSAVDVGNLLLIDGASLLPPPPAFNLNIDGAFIEGIFTFHYDRPSNLDHVGWVYDYSYDLVEWIRADAETDYQIVDTIIEPDGIERVTAQWQSDPANNEVFFVRVNPISLR